MLDIFSQLRRDEGERLKPYQDSEGIWTAGVGHNLEAHGQNIPTVISPEQSEKWLKEDVATAEKNLVAHCEWVASLDTPRYFALVNMCFNLGIGRLLGFHHFLATMQDHDWQKAHDEMLNSKWAGQVGPRAKRLSEQILKGEWV